MAGRSDRRVPLSRPEENRRASRGNAHGTARARAGRGLHRGRLGSSSAGRKVRAARSRPAASSGPVLTHTSRGGDGLRGLRRSNRPDSRSRATAKKRAVGSSTARTVPYGVRIANEGGVRQADSVMQRSSVRLGTKRALRNSLREPAPVAYMRRCYCNVNAMSWPRNACEARQNAQSELPAVRKDRGAVGFVARRGREGVVQESRASKGSRPQ